MRKSEKEKVEHNSADHFLWKLGCNWWVDGGVPGGWRE